ncbi:MAG: flagellar biosynthesis protein FlhB [Gammaproteobacteria bacterium]|nr:flagellar biosynthesis protein FlhB [Gammaproteobacteria bacterium]
MAENEQGQEKTEDATAKKLQDARQKGQVPRSREFNTFFMMIAGATGLLFMGADIVRGLMSVIFSGFSLQRKEIFDTNYMLSSFWATVLESLQMLTPFFILLVFVAIASSLVIGGWNFAMGAITPKPSKMNPISGLKRILGPKGLVELGKALGKFFVVGGVAVLLMQTNAEWLISVGSKPMEPALAETGNELLWYFLILSLSLLVVAAIDAPFQLWDNKNQLKMSKDEVKQEHKSQEGSPETRARVRQAQRDMAMKRMMSEVPQADVVITNPTHYAIALKYDQTGGGAPVVVAKGADLVAAKIRALATENRVPLLSSPALARAIYYSTEIDDEIPAALYVAVAKVLAYVFQLAGKPGTDFSSPIPFEDVTIPDELRRDE